MARAEVRQLEEDGCPLSVIHQAIPVLPLLGGGEGSLRSGYHTPALPAPVTQTEPLVSTIFTKRSHVFQCEGIYPNETTSERRVAKRRLIPTMDHTTSHRKKHRSSSRTSSCRSSS